MSNNGIHKIQKNVWSKRLEQFNFGIEQMNNLYNDHFFVAGLMLYWGEGTKKKHTAISNSNCNLIRTMVLWFKKYHQIKPFSLKMQIHKHSGQNDFILRQYWSEATGIPIKNFTKIYTKPQINSQRKKLLYFGTVKLRVFGQGSTYLLYKILGSIAQYNNIILNKKINIIDWIDKPTYS